MSDARRAAPIAALACALVGLALAASACGRNALDHPTGPDSGSGGGSQVGGQSGATGAAGVGGATGDVPCQQITDEQACGARGAACRVDGCTGFVRCSNPDDPRLPCSVPPQYSCSMFVNPSVADGPPSALCLSVPWCHPIFTPVLPPELCANPSGCIMFISCGDNGTANCADATGTRCGGDPPACAAGYAPSINSTGCYDGCVPLSYCGS